MKILFIKSIIYAFTTSEIVFAYHNYFGVAIRKTDVLWAIFVLFGLLITIIKDIIDHKIKTNFWSVFLSILISIIVSLLVKYAGFSDFKTYFISLFSSIFAPSILLQLMEKGLVKDWILTALENKFNPKKQENGNI